MARRPLAKSRCDGLALSVNPLSHTRPLVFARMTTFSMALAIDCSHFSQLHYILLVQTCAGGAPRRRPSPPDHRRAVREPHLTGRRHHSRAGPGAEGAAPCWCSSTSTSTGQESSLPRATQSYAPRASGARSLHSILPVIATRTPSKIIVPLLLYAYLSGRARFREGLLAPPPRALVRRGRVPQAQDRRPMTAARVTHAGGGLSGHVTAYVVHVTP
mmetsp:Transcript_20203/g.63822  ORF Transcript_20203/g.63822 Transcript_20203/m.63822 type:complete len:216 (-) Transcript_20203:27-674(-)